MHMITLHDPLLATVVQNFDLEQRQEEPEELAEQQVSDQRALVSHLVTALIHCHRRFDRVYGYRTNPMADYLKESLTMERDHLSKMISLVQNII